MVSVAAAGADDVCGVVAGGVIGAVVGAVVGVVVGAVAGGVTGGVGAGVVGGMAAGVAGADSGAAAAGGASVTTPTEGRDFWASVKTARPDGGFRKKFATPASSASNTTLTMAIFNQRLGVGACSARALQALGISGVVCKAAEIFLLQKV